MRLSFADGAAGPQPHALLPPALASERAFVALRSALQAEVCAHTTRLPSNEARLRRALRLMCDDARRRGVRAEQMIVVLKEAWRSLPEVQRLPAGGPADAVLSGVITTFIEEYYASPGGAS